MNYTIKQVADLAGVTVRALHHYDRMGLLKAASRSRSGYRLYDPADLQKLQQIMFFRELGFSLGEIREILNSPGFDRHAALLAHRQILAEKQKRMERLIASVDRTIKAMERGISMEEHVLFDGFDESKLEEYREEARRRWGTSLVDESCRRTAAYTKEDWDVILTEGREIENSLAVLMDRGAAPDDPGVQQLIGRHFQRINDRFYPCSKEIFRGLGDLYVNDSRFKANYELVRAGMAEFMRAAIRVYCESPRKGERGI